jgi:hypothetical protein
MKRNRMIPITLLLLMIFSCFVGCKKPAGDKPHIISAEFTSDIFTVEQDLTINATITSPLPAQVIYTWYVNGNEVYGMNEKTLATTHFEKHDRVSCTITVTDSLGKEAEPVTVGPVVIENTIPRILWADIIPNDSIYKGIDLTIDAETEDPDGDDVEIRYTWFVGNSIVSTDSILPGDLLAAGEHVLVELVPFDGDTTGEMFEVKRPIIVQNTPPILFGITNTIIQDNMLTCTINAHDPDGDPLTFALESAPSGMTIDSTGVINWEFQPPSKDTTFIITVSVTDDKGAGQKLDIPFELKQKPGEE